MLCTNIVFAFVYFATCQFLVLHKLVVNLCVTPHVHASLAGGMLGSSFYDVRFSIAAVLALFSPVCRWRRSCTCPATTCDIHLVTFARVSCEVLLLLSRYSESTDVCLSASRFVSFNDGVCLELVKCSTAGLREDSTGGTATPSHRVTTW